MGWSQSQLTLGERWGTTGLASLSELPVRDISHPLNFSWYQVGNPRDGMSCRLEALSLAFCQAPSWFLFKPEVTIFGGVDSRVWLRARGHCMSTYTCDLDPLDGSSCLNAYWAYFSNIYQMNTVLYWRRLETPLFTVVTNQVRRLVFS